MNLNGLGSGIAILPLSGGINMLTNKMHPDISVKIEKNITPFRILIISIHGWGPIDSRDEKCSAEMALRLQTQFRNYFDPVLVFTMTVCNSGTTDERALDCVKEIESRPDRLNLIDLVAVVGHSQGAVVGMKVVDMLLASGLLRGKRVGILSLAGVHGGTFEPISNPLRPATAELFRLSQAMDAGTQAYSRTVSRVLSAGVRVLAFHSFGDNVVNVASSTMEFLDTNPSNLALGVYFPKSHSGELVNENDRWFLLLVMLYLRGRNVGFQWHPSLSALLIEADPYSKLATRTYPLQLAFNWAVQGYPSLKLSDCHSEIVQNDVLYSWAALWMISDNPRPQVTFPDSVRDNIVGNIEVSSYYSNSNNPVLDLIRDELLRAENYDSRLVPYTQPILHEIAQFRNNLKLDFLSLKETNSYKYYTRMVDKFMQMKQTSTPAIN